MKNFVRFLFRCWFKLTGVEFKNNLSSKSNVIFVSNCVSWLDPIILFAFLPNNPVFLIYPKMYKNFWIRLFLIFANKKSFDDKNLDDVKLAMDILNSGKSCVIFPENGVSPDGEILKLSDVAVNLSVKTNVAISPVFIWGSEYSVFSNAKECFYQHLFPKIKVSVFGEKVVDTEKLQSDKDYSREFIFNVLNQARFDTKFDKTKSIFEVILDTNKRFGKAGFLKSRKVFEDMTRKPVSFRSFLIQSYVLGGTFSKFTDDKENVGIILPNMTTTASVFTGLSAYNRVPVMLNFSLGGPVVSAMCKTAVIRQILTSRMFVRKANLSVLIDSLKNEGIKIIYLEDLVKQISIKDKLMGIWYYIVKKIPVKQNSSDVATILFTSGSEGFPKAVLLSHTNILANIYQTASFEILNQKDIMFNALPMFHSFGLCVGFLFALICGSKIFFFPSPLQYRAISDLLYELKATIMVATDTFYKMYAKISHPYDFKTVRLCYAGAEAVKPETRNLINEKLGVRLMEAYGTTECAPVLCVNSYLHNKFGTLGILPPSLDYKLEFVDGIKDGGELCIKGPNVMLGYMYYDNPGKLVPVADGWYHTGDVVEIDSQGFVKIVDRIKKFAKIAGEMISLTVVENLAYELWNKEDFRCSAIAVPSEKKGEQIVLVLNDKSANKQDFINLVHKKNMSELFIPVEIMYLDELPLLATGKMDRVKLKQIVIENLNK